MINETLLDSYCEWVWYNVTHNTTSFTPEVILPNDTSDDDNPEYHLMYHIPKYNQMCLMKFNDLFLPEDYFDEIENILQKIMFPYYILIVLLGLLGNCLTICVYYGTKLRYSSPSVYLGALAISDNCYLITMLARRHLNPNLELSLNLEKCTDFLLCFCACLSVWIMIIFTVERFIVIQWPLRRKSLCTVTRAKITIIILTIFTFFVNIFEFVLVYIQSDVTIFRLCRTVITIVIPLLVITMFNILILYNLYKSYRNRRTLTANSIASNENQNYENWMSQAKILLVVLAFMFFNMPFCIARISFLYCSMELRNDVNIFLTINRNNVYPSIIYTLALIKHIKVVKQHFFWTVITLHIYNANFGLNFLLYCVTGKNFRKELVKMFTKSVNQLQNCYVHITNR